MYEFQSSDEYALFANANNLPVAESFKEFMENYTNYWAKNSKWYLP